MAARCLQQDFFEIWSPAMAYLLGYFAADGCMILNRRGGTYIEFTTTDRCLLTLLKGVTGASQRISVRPKRNNKWRKQYRIQIGNKRWFSSFSQLGFSPAKSKTLRLPPIPVELFGHFTRGYFDGDGCVYFKNLQYADRRYKRWILMTSFTSGSRVFLESLWSELKREGVHGGGLQKKEHGFELKFSHRDSLALYRLMYHTDEVSNMFLPRKRKKLERAIKVLGLDKSCGCSSTVEHFPVTEEVVGSTPISRA